MVREGAETGMARVFIDFLRREILRRYAPQNDKSLQLAVSAMCWRKADPSLAPQEHPD
jgi:hypothetical protein